MNLKLRDLTLVVLFLLVGIGIFMTFFEVKPFWVDEWFIIDNLKNKSYAELWRPLHFMQQFPRTYLSVFKAVTSAFHYSYISLRIISLLVSISAIGLAYYLGKRLFANEVTRYLFVLIIVSSFTFTEYFVETKQYPMDILVSLVALWQFMELARYRQGSRKKYSVLCASFFIAPFFSYTYLLVIAPVYLLVATSIVQGAAKKKQLLVPGPRHWLPLALGIIGAGIFYIIDGRQLASDRCMNDRWSFLMIDKNHPLRSIATSFYTLFAQVGAGLLFEIVFATLGICSFIAALVAIARSRWSGKGEADTGEPIKAYVCLVILITMTLFIMGRIPVGTPRLNVFTVPSIAILVILLVNRLWQRFSGNIGRFLLPALLYAGVIGNLFTWYIHYFTSTEYQKQMTIFNNTQAAIRWSVTKKSPIFITPGVTYPYEQAVIDAGDKDPAAWVLKTFPAYPAENGPAVYAVPDTASALISAGDKTTCREVIVGDGTYYRILKKY